MAVSYTHLDVYKRQAYREQVFKRGYRLRRFVFPQGYEGVGISGQATRLDVYKRQVKKGR